MINEVDKCEERNHVNTMRASVSICACQGMVNMVVTVMSLF